MKKSLLSLLILFSFLQIHSQQLSWIRLGAGDVNIASQGELELGYAIVTSDDAVYISGLANGNQVSFEDTVFSDVVNRLFCFVAKYDLSGNLQWARQLDVLPTANALAWGRTDIALNSKEELIVTGTTLFSKYSFLKKYDSEGRLLWEKQILENIRISTPTALTIDTQDAIILGGSYIANTPTQVEDTVISNTINGTRGAFIMKYDGNGNFQWLNSTIGRGYASYTDIKVDSKDNIVATGDWGVFGTDSMFIGDAYYQPKFDTSNVFPNPFLDFFLIKFNPDGQHIWTQALGGFFEDRSSKLALNNLDEIHLVGSYVDSLSIGGISIKGYGGADIMVGKFTPEGEIIWLNGAGGFNGQIFELIESGRSIAVDNDNNVLIVGSILGDGFFGQGDEMITVASPFIALTQLGFIAKYDSRGKVCWATNVQSDYSNIEDITYRDARVFISGNFFSRGTFLDTSIPGTISGQTNFFLAAIEDIPACPPRFPEGDDVRVFPNPTSDFFTFYAPRSEDAIEVSIFDVKGARIKSEVRQSGLEGVS
ncbi:MAG: hypothetical protein AAFR59_04275, partial [Bacteroidota bacterium]